MGPIGSTVGGIENISKGAANLPVVENLADFLENLRHGHELAGGRELPDN